MDYSDAGSGGAARRRGIDDARELQQRRRRQRKQVHEPSSQHQRPPTEHAETTTMSPGPQHGYDVGDVRPLSPSPGISRTASVSRSPASRASARSAGARRALSAQRRAMVQRRAERKRQEEQEREEAARRRHYEQIQQQQQMQQQQQQQRQQQQIQQRQHQQRRARVVSPMQSRGESPSGRPEHYHEQHYHRPQKQAAMPPQHDQPYQGQMARNAAAYYHGGVGYNSPNGQPNFNYSQGAWHAAQNQSHHQHPHAQIGPQYDYRQPQNHRRHSSGAQPYPPPQPPAAISSPPSVLRKQQYAPMPVYQGGSVDYSQGGSSELSPAARGVYDKKELERSGIIRNNGHDSGAPAQGQAPATNRLRKFSPYDSPSDEWHGHHARAGANGNGGRRPHPQLSRNQYARGGPGQPERQHQQSAPNRYHQQPMPAGPPQPIDNEYQSHPHQPQHQQSVQPRPNAPANVPPSVPAANPGERPPSQTQQQGQFQNQNQQRGPHPNTNEPNWEDIDRHHQENNRRRWMARNLAMKQKQHEKQARQQRREQEAQRVHEQQQQQQQQQQHGPRLSLSPVEHLGNRSDQMRRKVGFSISPDRKGLRTGGGVVAEMAPQDSPTFHEAEGEEGGSPGESSLRGSEHAHVAPASDREAQYGQRGRGARENGSRSRSLDRSIPSTVHADGTNQRRMPPQQQQQVAQPVQSNYVDEEGTVETLSVASLRKGWERQQQHPKPRAQSTSRIQASPNRAFGVWEERANRIAQTRRREQRREQRKNIEDRWMQRRDPSAALLPPSATRSRNGAPPPKRTQQTARYHDGYQSEGPPPRRSSDRYHGGYQSEGGEEDAYEGQEVAFDDARGVDAAVIAPKDARRRLWDDQERLRAVLPQDESFDSLGDARERWPHEHDDRPGEPHMSAIGSPSNRSGYSTGASSAAGSRFKPKFVHAAALAAQGRVEQENQTQGRAHKPSSQDKGQSRPTNELAASSHYTDSTADTTNITSNGSSHLRAASNQQGARFVRKVSPSPPGRPQKSASTMPSIDEGAPHMQTTSVAALIARINAVSRSNPEEALAAIDSIIKKEGGGGEDRRPQVASRSSGGGSRPSASRPPKHLDPFSPSRVSQAVSPPAKQQEEDGAVRRLGKEFFREESYEEVLRNDSERVIEMEGEEDDEDDSLLSSSAESTVSSMTDPTYQSLTPEKGPHRHSRRDPSGKTGHPRSGHHQHLSEKPRKSWDTLRREYHTRRMSPPASELDEAHTAEQQRRSKKATEHRNDIGVEEFNPDDIVLDRVDTNDVAPNGFCGTSYSTSRKSKSSSIEGDANAPPESSWVQFDGADGGKEQSRNSRGRRQAPARASRNPAATSHQTKQGRRPPKDDARVPKSMPELVSQESFAKSASSERNDARNRHFPSTPQQNVPPQRASTPEIMMAVSDAFSNVDISLEVLPASSKFSRPSMDAHDDPPLEHMHSVEGSLEEQKSPLQTMSEAFSDVDVNFEHGIGSCSSSFKIPPRKSASPSEAFATSWANEPPKKPTASSKFKKMVEPPKVRLKGNRSLANKFANLVKAFDD